MRNLAKRLLLTLTCAFASTVALYGHPAQFTTLQVTVRNDGCFEARVNIDLLAHALGSSSDAAQDAELLQLLDGSRQVLAEKIGEANDRFRRETVLRTDQVNIIIPAENWTTPDIATVETVLQRGIIPRTVVPGEIIFTGTLPLGARVLSVRLPYVLGATIHNYELPGGRAEATPVASGEFGPEVAFPEVAPPNPPRGIFARYVALGFTHILPKGVDHILFVLGLFLLSLRLRPLLWQVSAFTLAHTLTLALSLYGVVNLPASVVEPLIALSIVFIAVENLFTDRLRTWRTLTVFSFGLLHGLGFAGVLTEIGLPANARLTALLGFNIGVECGQLAVIAIAFLTIGWFRHHSWYRPAIAIPASLVICMTGAYWTLSRII